MGIEPASTVAEPVTAGTVAARGQGPLIARGLRKLYGRRAVVDGVDIELAPGETVALFGPNGAGKTTTFYMLVGFVRPNHGRIHLRGEDITAMPMHRRARRGLGYLAQEPSAFRRMTVRNNLMAILEFQPMTRQERERRADELLAEFHLTHLADAMAYTLSGGERRRLELARSLTTRPDFILLDEPFTGVDPKSTREIQRLIAALKAKGLGVFITDHSVRETLAITDRVYLMFDGRVVFSGPPDEFAADRSVRSYYLGDEFRL